MFFFLFCIVLLWLSVIRRNILSLSQALAPGQQSNLPLVFPLVLVAQASVCSKLQFLDPMNEELIFLENRGSSNMSRMVSIYTEQLNTIQFTSGFLFHKDYLLVRHTKQLVYTLNIQEGNEAKKFLYVFSKDDLSQPIYKYDLSNK